MVDARSDEELAAIRLRATAAQPAVWVSLNDSVFRYSRLSACAKSAPEVLFSQQLQPTTGIGGIRQDIDQSLSSRDDELRDHAALTAYLKLSPILVGALDGCIAGSLFSRLCTRYARAIAVDDIRKHSSDIRALDSASLRRTDAELCALAGLTRRPRTLKN